MALPSQTERLNDSGRAVSYKPSSGGPSRAPLLIVGGLVIVGAAAAIYMLANYAGTPTPADANGAKELGKGDAGKNDKLVTQEGSRPSLSAIPPARKPDPSPVVINLGTDPQSSVTPTSQPGPSNPSNPPANNPPANNPSANPGANPGTSGANPGSNPGSNPGTTPLPGPDGTRTTPPPGETGKPGGVDVTNPNPTNPGTPNNPANTPGTSPTGPQSPIPATGSTGEVLGWISEGERKQKSGDLLGARVLWSKALVNPRTSKADQESLRSKLTTINDELVFSKKAYAGDPMVKEYTVQSGDRLIAIAKKQELATDYRLIERINKIDPSKLKIGQKLKLVRGPFHAVVNKSDYRLDLYWGVPTDPSNWIYVRSFKVGLGQNTPVGDFTLKAGSKQVNPPWTNPFTGEKFGADDPKNPIGERWIGIEGQGDAAKFKGFGIHGTVEPDSIGQSKSMGCVRMLSDDVNLVYEMLIDPISVVKLQP